MELRIVHPVVSISAALQCNCLAFGWLCSHTSPGQPLFHDVEHPLTAARVPGRHAGVICVLQEVEAHVG